LDQPEKVLEQFFSLLARNLVGKARVRLGQGNDWIVALRGAQIALTQQRIHKWIVNLYRGEKVFENFADTVQNARLGFAEKRCIFMFGDDHCFFLVLTS
jgi:hypothetical protein